MCYLNTTFQSLSPMPNLVLKWIFLSTKNDDRILIIIWVRFFVSICVICKLLQSHCPLSFLMDHFNISLCAFLCTPVLCLFFFPMYLDNSANIYSQFREHHSKFSQDTRPSPCLTRRHVPSWIVFKLQFKVIIVFQS